MPAKISPPTLAAIKHAERGATRQQTYRHWLNAYIAHHGKEPLNPIKSFNSLVAYHLRHIYPARRRGRKLEPPQQKFIDLMRQFPQIRFSHARILWMHWYQEYHGYLPDNPEAAFASIWSTHAPASRKQDSSA